MSTDSANQLQHYIGRSALKDKHAFSLLYKETSSKIFAVLVRILKSQALAEEALQETYIKLWNKASTYDGDKGEVITWIAGIARYSALDLLRRQKTRQKYETEYELGNNEDNAGDSINHLLTVEDNDSSALNECLNRLQPDARRSIVMAYCEGYTHEELSQRLNKPIGTIKSWIRRSLKRLQECIYELSRS